MKKLIILTFILTLSTLQLLAQDAFSMKSTAQGFSAALHVGLTGHNNEDLDIKDESGIGVGLLVGYGLTERIEVYLEYDLSTIKSKQFLDDPEAEIEPYKFTQAELGLRLNFGGTIGKLRTFIEGAVTYQKCALTFIEIYDFDNEHYEDYYYFDMMGYGATFGVGAKYHINLPLALKIGGKYTIGTFSEVTINDTNIKELEFENEIWQADSYRIYGGVVYYF